MMQSWLLKVSYIAMCYTKATSCKTQVGIFLSAPKCREDQHKIPAKFHLGVKCWKTHLHAITDLMDVNAKREGKHMYHPNTTCSWSRSVYDLQFLILVCDVHLLWLKTEPKQFLKNSNRTWVYTYLLMDPLVSPFFL